jgi:formamidopyrimidine-DNA glycosylase
MPELPEVETTRLSLAPRIEGARILEARLGKPLRWPLGIAPQALRGWRIGALARRGKYLWMPLRPTAAVQAHGSAQGEPAATADVGSAGLLLHLGMSGALRFEAQPGRAGVHDHFELDTDRGTLRLTDPRRFGAVVWSAGLDQEPAATLLARLGIEPLEPGFDAVHLHRGLRGRRVAIKQALLAGDLVVGVGNIYCAEALFRAGIDPRAAAGRISLARCDRLASAIRDVLHAAIGAGGSTLRDFSDAQGHAGAFQEQAAVYGREGLPCPACTTPVRRIVQGQRSTFFCPRCQRR